MTRSRRGPGWPCLSSLRRAVEGCEAVRERRGALQITWPEAGHSGSLGSLTRGGVRCPKPQVWLSAVTLLSAGQ